MTLASPLRRVAHGAFGYARAAVVTASLTAFVALGLSLVFTSCFSPAAEAGPGGKITRHGWTVSWINTTGSLPDGTAFFNATYRGISVFSDYRIPFSYVDYGSSLPPYRDIVDQLGVIAWDGRTPTFRGCSESRAKDRDVPGILINCEYTFDIPGYEWQDEGSEPVALNCATYRYTQKLYLYADGAFRPEVTTWGPGYRNPHAYIVGMRLDMAVGRLAQPGDAAYAYGKTAWHLVSKEGPLSLGKGDLAGYTWAVRADPSATRPLAVIKPGGDSPVLTVLRSSGDSYDGYRQSTTPAEFDQDEAVAGGDLYLWYRGAAANPGCTVLPSPIGPTLIRLFGY